MDDLISRQAAKDALEREKTYSAVYKYGYTQADYFKQYNMGLTDGIKALNKLPSVQPEIIRCKDCKYCDNYIAEITSDGNMERMEYRCKDFHASVMPDEYCSRGERRNG